MQRPTAETRHQQRRGGAEQRQEQHFHQHHTGQPGPGHAQGESDRHLSTALRGPGQQ